MRYLVHCDLHQPLSHYRNLQAELARLGARKITFAHWIVERDGSSASALLTQLSRVIGAGDALLVVAIAGWAAHNVEQFDRAGPL